MTKKVFFSKMKTMQKDLDEMKSALYFHINQMFDDSGKGCVPFEKDKPVIYFEGDSIVVETLLTSEKIFGIGENGVDYELDIAELGVDDIKMIAEALANEVLK